MKTTKIYRYETIDQDKNIIGAYGGRYTETLKDKDAYDTILRKMTHAHSNSEHPPIWGDLTDFVSGEHFCACPSLKSLLVWFKGFNQPLIKVGYQLVEVEVKKVYKTNSGLQICFKQNDVITKKVIKSLVD